MPNLDVVHRTPVATELLLMRNLMSFQEHNIVGKGEFYKKGHLVQSWRHRAYVVNDFSANREEPSNREGSFRYFKPQGALDYDRDTSRDIVSTALGMNADQKTIKLDTCYFYKGPDSNVRECETIFKTTAFPLNITFVCKKPGVVDTIAGQKEDTFEYQLVFDYKEDAEDFIRALYQASKKCPNLRDFIKDHDMNAKNCLRLPRLTFTPDYQTALGCCKISPYFKFPDCVGWGSYCLCCCAEMYTQGGLIFDMDTPRSQTGHGSPQVYAQCCVIEAIVCECRMVRYAQCKVEQQICCIDNRFSCLPDDDVPCALALCGGQCCGSKPKFAVNPELMPLISGSKQPEMSGLDKARAMVGGNML